MFIDQSFGEKLPKGIDAGLSFWYNPAKRLKISKNMTELRSKPPAKPELVIDFKRHHVSVAGKEVRLRPLEYSIIAILARSASQIITQDQLLEEVWGREYRGDRHILQVTVSRLRRSIGDNARNPLYIRTHAGIGYSLIKQHN